VRLEKAGYSPASTQLKVASGERPKLRLNPAPVGELAASAPPAGEVNRTPFWISASSALALGGAALTFGLLARDANQALEDELDRYPADESDIDAARTRLRTYAGLTDATAVAALVATGFAIYYAIAPPRRRASARETSSRTVKLAPAAGGVALHGTF
jgi:hypothetical protein